MTSGTTFAHPETISRRLFTREEYHRAGERGVFGPEERLELIGGEVVQKMSPQRSLHATSVSLGEEALRQAFGPDFHVRNQLPLALSVDSEPEPDLCVVKGRVRDYEREHPAAAVLVVEVSDTTLAFDRQTKACLYASAGIPDFWIVNLPGRGLEVHRDPEPDAEASFGFRYRTVLRFTESESLAPLAAPGHEIAEADLLPRA